MPSQRSAHAPFPTPACCPPFLPSLFGFPRSLVPFSALSKLCTLTKRLPGMLLHKLFKPPRFPLQPNRLPTAASRVVAGVQPARARLVTCWLMCCSCRRTALLACHHSGGFRSNEGARCRALGCAAAAPPPERLCTAPAALGTAARMVPASLGLSLIDLRWCQPGLLGLRPALKALKWASGWPGMVPAGLQKVPRGQMMPALACRSCSSSSSSSNAAACSACSSSASRASEGHYQRNSLNHSLLAPLPAHLLLRYNVMHAANEPALRQPTGERCGKAWVCGQPAAARSSDASSSRIASLSSCTAGVTSCACTTDAGKWAQQGVDRWWGDRQRKYIYVRIWRPQMEAPATYGNTPYVQTCATSARDSAGTCGSRFMRQPAALATRAQHHPYSAEQHQTISQPATHPTNRSPCGRPGSGSVLPRSSLRPLWFVPQSRPPPVAGERTSSRAGWVPGSSRLLAPPGEGAAAAQHTLRQRPAGRLPVPVCRAASGYRLPLPPAGAPTIRLAHLAYPINRTLLLLVSSAHLCHPSFSPLPPAAAPPQSALASTPPQALTQAALGWAAAAAREAAAAGRDAATAPPLLPPLPLGPPPPQAAGAAPAVGSGRSACRTVGGLRRPGRA